MNQRLSTRIRSILIATAFKKIALLSQENIPDDANIGMISHDIIYVMDGVSRFHNGWAGALQITIYLQLLVYYSGLSALLVIVIPIGKSVAFRYQKVISSINCTM